MALCKCGRSPNGQCNGWHKLSHPEFLRNLREHERKNLTSEAKEKFLRKKDENSAK
jgi:hypothetical protein